MTHNGKNPRPPVHNAAHLQAFAQLDRALAQNTPSDDCKKINLLRARLFGIVAADESEKSGPVEIPN
jgi:hypothetical protein